MEIIIDSYNVYENIHTKLVLEEKTDNYIFVPVEIMGNNKYFYLFNVFGIPEIIIKLDKNVKKERRFKSILNSMNKTDRLNIETAKMNCERIKGFVLSLLNVSQFDFIIRMKENIAFEKGKEAKIKEVKDVFKI